jgi:hypothetical protein
MVVRLAVRILDQVVEQVDRHDEKSNDHECDERASTKIDAGLRVVNFFARPRLESIFLCNTLGEKLYDEGMVRTGEQKIRYNVVSILRIIAFVESRGVRTFRKGNGLCRICRERSMLLSSHA